MARYKIKLDQRGREVATAQSSVRAITAEARRHIDATFPGFDPAACFRQPAAAHASLHFYAAEHEWWAYPDNPTTWLVGVCVPYNPRFAPRVREIRPTGAVREVMRQHGWSWQIVEWQTRLALERCEEVDYPMTEFAIPITQVQFYTWPIGDSDEVVRLDLYEPPWERADIEPAQADAIGGDICDRPTSPVPIARPLVESLREGRPEGTPFRVHRDFPI